MNEYGTLHEMNGRYALQFVRFYNQHPDSVFKTVTNPDDFTQWYPFATGKMELEPGGKIAFNDGEGSTYEGIITKFEPPLVFAFREVDDLLEIGLQPIDEGCRLTFTHTFDDRSMAVPTAAGWHQCLDVLGMIIEGNAVQWPNKSVELRETYNETFNNR